MITNSCKHLNDKYTHTLTPYSPYAPTRINYCLFWLFCTGISPSPLERLLTNANANANL